MCLIAKNMEEELESGDLDQILWCSALRGSGRAQQLSIFPQLMAYSALWGEAGESIRCLLGEGSPVTGKIMNSFVLPKAQNQLRGEKETQL